MKSAVRKLKPADADALKAAAWYDERQPGLGDAFFDDVEAAIALLTENPLIAWPMSGASGCDASRVMEFSISSLARKSGRWQFTTAHGIRAGCANGGASSTINF